MRIRIYDLAKELRKESKQILEDARRLGADVSVPSNTIDIVVEYLIRSQYSPKKNRSYNRSTARLVKKHQKPPRSTRPRKLGLALSRNLATPKNIEPLRLSHQRGKRIGHNIECSECHTIANPVWNYPNSNHGRVNVCSRCKFEAFKRSSDQVDAMELSCQGGSFDSNRRKH